MVHSLEAATTAVAVVKTVADSLITAVVAKTAATITAAAINPRHKKSRSLFESGTFFILYIQIFFVLFH